MQAEGDVVRLPREAEAPPDFTAFFAEEPRGLFKALYFVTGNRADAQELMQEAFLTLWERWDTIDRIDDPTGYLFRVALDVRLMLRSLSPRQRAALVLLDLYGYGSEDAAAIMRIRPSTVRALATQGRAVLRTAGGPHG